MTKSKPALARSCGILASLSPDQVKKRLVWLDLVRGLSAIAVCSGHLRSVLFVDFGSLASRNPLTGVFYFVTSLGHQAVIVFFVLSGYFVGGRVLARDREFRLTEYSIARLSRLWTVLVPALVLTALTDQILSFYHPAVLRGVSFDQWNSGPESAAVYSTSFKTLFGNLFFLQTILVPVFGSNSPLWSLANEFWYYALFPLVAIAAGATGGSTTIVKRFWCGAAGLALLLVLPFSLLPGFAVWLMGAGISQIANRCARLRRQVPLFLSFALFFLGLVLAKSNFSWLSHSALRDLALGASFAPLCLVLATWSEAVETRTSRILARIAVATSEISYSLYAYHFPLVLLIAVFLLDGNQSDPSLSLMSMYLVCLSALLTAAVVLWSAFERNTEVVRKRLTVIASV